MAFYVIYLAHVNIREFNTHWLENFREIPIGSAIHVAACDNMIVRPYNRHCRRDSRHPGGKGKAELTVFKRCYTRFPRFTRWIYRAAIIVFYMLAERVLSISRSEKHWDGHRARSFFGILPGVNCFGAKSHSFFVHNLMLFISATHSLQQKYGLIPCRWIFMPSFRQSKVDSSLSITIDSLFLRILSGNGL